MPKTTLDLENSVCIDVRLSCKNKPEITGVLNMFMKKIEKVFTDTKEKKHIRDHMRIILTNLWVIYDESKYKNPKFLSINLNKNKYLSGTDNNKAFLEYKYIIYVFKYLKDNDYIEVYKGFHNTANNFGRITRIKCSNKLLHKFRDHRPKDEDKIGKIVYKDDPIRLGDDDGNDIIVNYNNKNVKEMAKQVKNINKKLSEYNIEIQLYPEEIQDIKNRGIFNRDHTKYYRKFCRYRKNDQYNYDRGGRFYGHFSQMINKSQRQRILINGQETIEADYSALHPSMLYAFANIKEPEGDIYYIPELFKLYKDDSNQVKETLRKYIKKSFNIALNARSEKSAQGAINIEFRKIKKEVKCSFPKGKKMVGFIKNYYKEIAKKISL